MAALADGDRGALALLVHALAQTRSAPEAVPPFRWIARPMGVRVGLDDEDALLDAMDERPQ